MPLKWHSPEPRSPVKGSCRGAPPRSRRLQGATELGRPKRSGREHTKRSRGFPPAEVSGPGSPEPLVPAHPPPPHRLRPQISAGACLEWETTRNGAETGPPGALEGNEGAPGSTRPAEGRPRRRAGAGPAKSTRATGWFRLRSPGGTQGLRGAGHGRCGVPLPPAPAHTRAPRPSPRLHGTASTCPQPGRRPNRSAQVRAPGPGTSGPGGTWPGEGRPAGDGACAVARARPSAGKEHAQCEGTIGYVGAWGMLGESPDPAHAQKRSEPATRWWREKRGEKSPQSYVRKGRVLRGGCGLPRGPAVLLGRGA